ncbi:hypothetical protein [Dysgonomonas sp.]
MATDNKNNKETAVKPGKDSVETKPEKVEATSGDGKLAEGLQNRVPESTVVVDATKDNEELDRIAGIVRSAYEGKGTFLEMSSGFGETLIGKSKEEIIEAVKPYFIFTDGSLDDIDPDDDITQAANIVKGIAGLATKNEFKSKADELMKAQGLKEIWRCPNKGYWFSRKDYAENYKRENKCSLEHYKK